MSKRKAIIILPRLIDFDGDVTKRWYIEYSIRDAITGRMQRCRDSKVMNAIKDVKRRRAYCEKRINELTKQINLGETAVQNKRVIYDDQLEYSYSAKLYGRQRVSNVTVRTYLSEFLARKKSEIIPHSYSTYTSKLRIFCSWLDFRGLSGNHVSTITQENICEFFHFIITQKQVSRVTILKYRQILYNFFKFLQVNKRVIPFNPVYQIPNLGLMKDEAPVPIPEETRNILQSYMMQYDRQLWLVCMMQFYCAIRPGQELRLMKIGDINFDTHSIVVRPDIAKNRQKETVDIPDQLFDYMVNFCHLDQYSNDYYVFGHDGQPGTEHLGKNNFRNRFDRIRDSLNLPSYYKLYSFKHSGAVALMTNGFNTYDLQRHFRHKSIVTTEQYFRKNLGEHNEKMMKHFPDI